MFRGELLVSGRVSLLSLYGEWGPSAQNAMLVSNLSGWEAHQIHHCPSYDIRPYFLAFFCIGGVGHLKLSTWKPHEALEHHAHGEVFFSGLDLFLLPVCGEKHLVPAICFPKWAFLLCMVKNALLVRHSKNNGLMIQMYIMTLYTSTCYATITPGQPTPPNGISTKNKALFYKPLFLGGYVRGGQVDQPW